MRRRLLVLPLGLLLLTGCSSDSADSGDSADGGDPTSAGSSAGASSDVHEVSGAGLTFVAAAKGRPPEPGALSTSSAGPEVSPWQVNECLEKKRHTIRLAPSRLIRGTLVLISRS